MAKLGHFLYSMGEDPAVWPVPDNLAKSLVYICTWCGCDYAKLSVWKDPDNREPFSAVHGCCPSCPGNEYYLPGSLEAMSLLQWPVPPTVLAYQLNVELSFAERRFS